MKPTSPFRLVAYAVNYRIWLLATLTAFNLVEVATASAAALRLESLGQWPGWQRGLFQQLKVQGDFAYLTGSSGLTILNVANPANPQAVGRLDLNPLASLNGHFAVSGRYVYVAGGSAGLHVIDVGNPNKPVRVGGWSSGSTTDGTATVVNRVAVSGGYAYLLVDSLNSQNGEGSMIVMDISQATTPVLLSGVSLFNGQQRSFNGLTVSDGFAYVVTGNGVLVIDVNDPLTPFYLRMEAGVGGAGGGVAISGTRLLVADGSTGLGVFDLNNPAYPIFRGQPDTSGEARSVAGSGDLAYIADGTGGLKVIDIADLEAPKQLGVFQTDGVAVDLEVSDGRAYVLSQDEPVSFYLEERNRTARFEIIDVSNPSNPSRLGRYAEIPGFAHGVAASGEVALLADGKAGVRLINVTDRQSPQLEGTYDTPGEALGVAVAGDVAYVADNEAGLQILYIKDPAAPVRLSGFNSPGQAYGVAVTNGHAYLADGSAGLQIIRVSTPANPVRVGGYDTTGTAYGVAVNGAIAYVADGNRGLQIIDVSAPASPQRIGGYDTDGEVMGVALMGNYVLVADRLDGIFVLDVTAPQSPILVGSYTNSFQQAFNIGAPHSIAVRGQTAFVVGAGGSRLFDLDISDPASPQLAGVFNLKDGAYGVAVSGESVFLASGRSGLEILVDVGLRISPVGAFTAGGPFRFKWTTLPGKTYRPQFSTNLSANVWQDLPVLPVFQGTVAEVADPTPADPTRFYRIIEE